MPRRSARVAKQKRVNYNEDALFYKMTKTKKSVINRLPSCDPLQKVLKTSHENTPKNDVSNVSGFRVFFGVFCFLFFPGCEWHRPFSRGHAKNEPRICKGSLPF